MASHVNELGSNFSEHRGALTQKHEGPTIAHRRWAVLDVLRGFALLGILLLNIDSFSGPSAIHDVPIGLAKPAFVGWHATLDLIFFSVKWLFFEGKMRTLFSILYGAGIVILTERLEGTGKPNRAADIFCRRNMWLLLFGLIHGTLIWQGDILSQYALVALLFMFPFRKVAAKWLIVLGLTIGIAGGTFGVVQMTQAPRVFAAQQLRDEGNAALKRGSTPSPEQKAALDAEVKTQSAAPAAIAKAVEEGRASYFESISRRTDEYLNFVLVLFRTGWILEVVGSMLLGMGLFKSGFLVGAFTPRTYALTAIAAYAVSIPIVTTGVVMTHVNEFSVPSIVRWLFLSYEPQIFAGAIANASLLLLLFKSGWLSFPLKALANIGRTAFSNYILTSLLCQFLFAWGPWKLYGAIEYYQQIFVILVMWTFNVLASALWLRHFNYGPLEWAWRSLVYWKRPPILRAQWQA